MSDPFSDPYVREFILGFADDEHLMGQQHTEWIGAAPFLEEDLAMASIGQDELGHAAHLYALLAGDDDQAIDELAFGRGATDYRSCHLVEYTTTNWAEQLVRHFLYDAAEELRWQLFERSSDVRLRELATFVAREESFHRRHADGLLSVLLQTAKPRREVYAALQTLLPLALGLFEPVAGEAAAIEAGIVSGSFNDQLPAWSERVTRVFAKAQWDVEAVTQQARTQRSVWFDPLMSRMREVIELDPEAVW